MLAGLQGDHDGAVCVSKPMVPLDVVEYCYLKEGESDHSSFYSFIGVCLLTRVSPRPEDRRLRDFRFDTVRTHVYRTPLAYMS